MNISEMELYQLIEISRIIEFRIFLKLLPMFGVSVILYIIFLIWLLKRRK